MKSANNNLDFDTKQYYTQANIVYISTFFSLIILIPVFISIGNPLIVILNIVSLVVSALAIYLNRKSKYGLASWLFISAITLQNVCELALFGRGLGFAYYFFTIVVLIIYTKWSDKMRFSAILIVVIVAIGAFFYTETYPAAIVLSYGYVVFFNIINTLFNIAGVANSANFYVNTARRAQKELKKMAMQDYLTGLPNRAALQDYLQKYMATHKESTHNFGVLMMDIDHFKNVNDTYGHSVGDMVLKQTSILLQQHKKDSDFAGRYGGEEFIMLIQVDSLFELKSFAEHIRIHFEEANFVYRDLSLKATISIGAVYKQCNGYHEFDLTINQADELLYKAKQEGRNRVVAQIYSCHDSTES